MSDASVEAPASVPNGDPVADLIARVREQVGHDSWNGYKPFDQDEHIRWWRELAAPAARAEYPERADERVDDIAEWELVHGHSVLQKCYVEFGCTAVEGYSDHLLMSMLAVVEAVTGDEMRDARTARKAIDVVLRMRTPEVVDPTSRYGSTARGAYRTGYNDALVDVHQAIEEARK